MSTTRTIACVALGALLLAACSKTPAGGAASSASASAAAPAAPTSGPDVAINVADLPHPRAGLWERTSSGGDGAPAYTTRTCVADKPVDMSPVTKHCQTFNFHRTFTGAVVMDAQCMTNGVGGTTHSTITGDFQNGYTTDTVMSMVIRPGATPMVIKNHAEAHWVGPCPPGHAPQG